MDCVLRAANLFAERTKEKSVKFSGNSIVNEFKVWYSSHIEIEKHQINERKR